MKMNQILKYLLNGVLIVVSPVISYLLFAVLLSLIPVNRNAVTGGDTEIYIRSNGVHLELLLPVSTPYKDWSEAIQIDSRIKNRVHFLSFGWGDRNFYLHTPEWSDLTFGTAFTALLQKSPSAMHIDFYSSVDTGRLCKRIHINSDQYLEIIHFVDSAFQRDTNGHFIEIKELHYAQYDRFYEATGSYHLFYTCNTWTNQCLKNAGLRACLWTPFDRGTLFHYGKK